MGNKAVRRRVISQEDESRASRVHGYLCSRITDFASPIVIVPVPEIARALHNSDKTVQRALNDLETAGCIRPQSTGPGRPNAIVVLRLFPFTDDCLPHLPPATVPSTPPESPVTAAGAEQRTRPADHYYSPKPSMPLSLDELVASAYRPMQNLSHLRAIADGYEALLRRALERLAQRPAHLKLPPHAGIVLFTRELREEVFALCAEHPHRR